MVSHGRSRSLGRPFVYTGAPSRADACSRNHREGYAFRCDAASATGYDSSRWGEAATADR